MNTENEILLIKGVPTTDLFQASRNAQRIDINGHDYVITEVSTDFNNSNECCAVQLKRSLEDKSDKLIDLVKAIRKKDNEIDKDFAGHRIRTFDQKKYIQAVTNLAEGMPASVVAESLDKAAEYVRNQGVQGYWEEK
ncbi:hypothetical protein [Secundilactobacillus yichangensis]|uniref:hypothetical protein n=1 Tax=Secundilactobacillus yichangensis TaxID=2799580 RepID=UPI00194580EB|nr:hypothetical protein [Secundilactobacillus yichangensis]